MLRLTKSYFDSLGVMLPDRRVTTAEILEGCRNQVRLPLERLTGIHARRLAGDGLYSIDLAEGALRRCLDQSPAAAEDYGLLICTNISRRDGPNTFSYEPAAAVTLKRELGLTGALALDLTNACAGMWTGVYLADALIRTGEVRHALVVSGEYISYLIETAQREITGFMDPQIASLTLGDAGVAVSLGVSPSPEVGLHDLDLYTLSKYSPYCIAKPTDQEHGGAVMYTDAIKVTEAVVPHAARHAKLIVDRNGWPLERIDHIVPHQTSQLTMQEAKKEIQRLYQYDFGDCFLNNLAERGNTSSNSHFLALFDAIQAGRIAEGQNLAFCISGSGQTTGTALYTMDSLPSRLTQEAGADATAAGPVAATLPVQLEIESIAFVDANPDEPVDTIEMLGTAAERSLVASRFGCDEVDLLVSVGTYRTEFVMEPAIAALVGGRLEMNHDRPADAEDKTLAFDVLSGPVGTLKAIYLASELARAGQIEQAMILASEVENNRQVPGEPLLGVHEGASAMLLSESADGESGFLGFGFYDFSEHHADQSIAGGWNDAGKAYLHFHQAADFKQHYLACVKQAAERFLEEQGLSRDELAVLLPPQVCQPFVNATADALGFSDERTVCVAKGEDFATSSLPAAYHAARKTGAAQSGDLGLVLTVGAGVQVGCALYRF
ncbi:MAG: 3-oxoacyl-[acyl-carrier-protein] synthase III C-terminal domain-containing protein [Planctomycetota bacterium]